MTPTQAIFDRLLREALLPRDLPPAYTLPQAERVIIRRYEMLGGDRLDLSREDIREAGKAYLRKVLS